MKKPILYIVLLLSTNFLFAQGSITFPSAPVDNNGIVDFTFDLAGGGAAYDLSVEVSFDGGSVTPTFYSIPAEDIISGTLNNVEPSSGISLQWDAMASFPGQVTSNALLRVTARHVCGTAFTFTYRGSSVTYGTVSKTYTIGGDDVTLCWMDRNLGADPMPFVPADATGNTDTRLYGDLFQWGRGDDGHQVRDPLSTITITLSPTDVPGHSNFIIPGSSPFDWRDDNNDNRWNANPQENNPCPPGWRVPTEAELNAERLSWGSNNPAGAYASTLKWPVGGLRSTTSNVGNVGSYGFVWSSSVSGTDARILLFFGSSSATFISDRRANGMSVRCVRDN